jgi:hypothetical protein
MHFGHVAARIIDKALLGSRPIDAGQCGTFSPAYAPVCLNETTEFPPVVNS